MLLTAGSMKKQSLYKMSYFPEPYTLSKHKIKVELDLTNNGTKSDLEIATGVNTLKFAKKVSENQKLMIQILIS